MATLTVGRDSPPDFWRRPVLRETDCLRRGERVICEVSRLAVDPDFSSGSAYRIFRVAHRYAPVGFGATDAVIEVNPGTPATTSGSSVFAASAVK